MARLYTLCNVKCLIPAAGYVRLVAQGEAPRPPGRSRTDTCPFAKRPLCPLSYRGCGESVVVALIRGA